ncbi:MAG TPA: ribonuclease HII [Membranihabitans sp.]|nr:ribonuclease HII [Membranihabitans sp.]
MSLIEHPLRKFKIIAGLDEAGRGCLAGPVVAAAVILPDGYFHDELNDSKQLTESRRNVLRRIIESEALAFSVAFVFPERIDAINILRGSIEAMHVALDSLTVKPEFLIVDGNRFYPYRDCPHQCVIKGDGKYLSIAAASILAKTYRDEYMKEQHFKYPVYGWERNKGYPTAEHRRGIIDNGVCHLHRKSFQLYPAQQIELF